MYMHKLDTLNPKTFVKMFDDMGALNDPESVNVLLRVGMCDERGRLGYENNPVDQLNSLLDKFDAYKSVKFADVFPDGQTDVNKIKQAMYRVRTRAVANT